MSELQQREKLSLKGKNKLRQQFKGQQSIIDGFLGLTEGSSINLQSEIVSQLNQSHSLLLNSRVKSGENSGLDYGYRDYAKNKQNSLLSNQQFIPSSRNQNNNDKFINQQSSSSLNYADKQTVKGVSLNVFKPAESSKMTQFMNINHKQQGKTQATIDNKHPGRLDFQSKFTNKNGDNNISEKILSSQYYFQAQQPFGTEKSETQNKEVMIKLKKSLSYNPDKTALNQIPQKVRLQHPRQIQNSYISYTQSQPGGSNFMGKSSSQQKIMFIQNNVKHYIPPRAFLKQKAANFNESLNFSYRNQNANKSSALNLSNHYFLKAKQMQNEGHRPSPTQFAESQNSQGKFRPPMPVNSQLNFLRNTSQMNSYNQIDQNLKRLRATIGTEQIHSSQFKEEQIRWQGVKNAAKQILPNQREINKQQSLQDNAIGKLNNQNSQKRLEKQHSSSNLKSSGLKNLVLKGYQCLSGSSENSKPIKISNRPSSPAIKNFQFGLPKEQGKTQFNQQTFIARQSYCGILVAIKKFKKKNVESHIAQFTRQLKIQMMIDSPNVVKIYGVLSDDQHIYVIQQYMEDGSLYALMKMRRNLQQKQVAQKGLQLAKGINALHQASIIHRKIRPQSIALTHGVCKIDDFSSATISDKRRETYYGSFGYTSPQMKSGQSYNQSNDTWCLGIIIYEMVNGKPPFYQLTRKESRRKLTAAPISFGQKFSNQSQKMLQKMLKANPDQRISIQQVLKQEFLRKVYARADSNAQEQLQLLL